MRFYIIGIISILAISSCSSLKYNKAIKNYRAEYKNNFDTEDHAPLKGNQLDSMSFYSPNKEYVVTAMVEIVKNPDNFEIETSSGSKKTFIKYAELVFKLKNDTVRLDLLRNIRLMAMPEYKEYLFLPFYDYTNGETTYGGGRYIDLYVSDIVNNSVIIDFNKSYNPYCAYSSGYNCPIPPVENSIPFKVEAGERLYLGKYIENNY